jgi:hypothetical protein
MAKVRSPNYPTISLRDAVARVQTVYSKEHKHPADREVIAKHLGYGSLNGASMSVVSALTKYGLLEQSGEQLRVSSGGEDVCLYEPNQPERVSALREAAFRPALFNELHDLYGDHLPSDAFLRASLVKQRGFNPNTVDAVIRSYRDTIEFLSEEDGATFTKNAEKPEEDDAATIVPSAAAGVLTGQPAPPSSPNNPQLRTVTIPLSMTDWATLQAPFPLSENSWDQMMAVLGAMKPALIGFPEQQVSFASDEDVSDTF